MVPSTGEVCDYVTEDNYVFKFEESLKGKLITWATEAISPVHVRNKVLADFADQKLEISISRPK